jgi:hypothetical protein
MSVQTGWRQVVKEAAYEYQGMLPAEIDAPMAASLLMGSRDPEGHAATRRPIRLALQRSFGAPIR